jgi:hypothetical protein
MYTIAEIEKLIATVEASMGECDFMTFPSPVRAMEVGALLRVARESIQLRDGLEARIEVLEAANSARQGDGK